MARPLWADRNATVTQITSRYNHSIQNMLNLEQQEQKARLGAITVS